MKLLDLTGNVYGRLLVLREGERRGSRKVRTWICRCSCGTEKEILMHLLRSGQTESCGCLQKELFSIRNTKHSKTNSLSYNSWRAMIDRCSNPKNNHYELYGGRGINFDPAWKDFINFYNDMGDRPQGLTLDRIDVNGNYCKENCRWASISEQNLNTNIRKDNKTGYKGVSVNGNYYAVSYRSVCVGYCKTLEEAIELRKLYETGQLFLKS